MKKKKGNSITFILILVLLAGLSLLLYPSVSDYWNSFHQTQAIASYAENVATMDQARYDALWQKGAGAVGNRANVMSILKDVAGRLNNTKIH